MREQIKFGLVRTREALESLQKFAESFDHKVGDDSILPIYTIERGQQVIGYYNMITFPIVCPAFHPKQCTPRDFHDTVQFAKTHFCLNSICDRFPNGTCLIALPRDLEPLKKVAVEKCGFKNTKAELWQAIP